MRPFITLIGVILTAQSFAQNTGIWSDGVAILNSGQVITGQICSPSLHDVVLYRQSPGSYASALPAHKVSSFRFFDEVADINRQYVSLRQPDRRSFEFFEVVVQGPVKVLRRARGNSSQKHDEILGYQYFCWDGDNLIPIRKFKSQMFPKIADEVKGLWDYVSTAHLDASEMKSAILIIREFNRVAQSRVLAQAR